MILKGDTSFRVDSQGSTERFSLQRGELSAHVAKLAVGQRFIIATPDAEVEVRGTRFRVHVLNDLDGCSAASRTRLEVSEGIVEVRALGATVAVAAGQRWPTDCVDADTPHSSLAPLEIGRSAASPNASSVRPVAVVPHAIATAPALAAADHASELAQQNDLFAEADALHRQGDVAGALRAYQTLIARFPASPLAENALVQRMRLLSNRRDPRTHSEAERYIARYPRGFALKEAQRLMDLP